MVLVNAEKCQLGKSEVKFIGQLITTAGCCTLPEKVSAIKDFPKPKTAQQLHRFLALVNYYRRYIPYAAEMQLALRALSPVNKKNDKTAIVWTEDAENAFVSCKESLSSASCLSYYDPDANLALLVDASDFAVGGALQQRQGDDWKPLGFFHES